MDNRSSPPPTGWHGGRLACLVLVLAFLVAWLATHLTDKGTMNRTPEPSKPRSDSTRIPLPTAAEAALDPMADLRRQMVDTQLRRRDITDDRVLETMSRVPRHRFVLQSHLKLAYADQALPIDYEQTISQPYIVALMTQLARPTASSKALDVGTGSGYQAAVLAELCQQVYSIEILEPLANAARQRLAELGYANIEVRHGDGYRGWPAQAPFDLILVAAAPDHVPQALIDQLAVGGRLVIPIGQTRQQLLVIEKRADGTIARQSVIPVAFVPMTGEAMDDQPCDP